MIASPTRPRHRELPTGTLTAAASPLDEALLRGFELALRAGWRPKVKSDQTVTAYLYGARSLVVFVRGRGMPALADLTREHVQEWVLALRATRAPATVGLYLLGARAFCAWLKDEGERSDDPTVRLSAPPLAKTLKPRFTLEQVQAVLHSQNPKTVTGLRNVALFHVLLDTGLRCAEVARLGVADIDWKHGTIQVTGKGAKERKVRIGALTTRALDAYLRRRERTLPGLTELWHGQRGRLGVAGIRTAHHYLTAALGFRVHPHRWRHTAIQSWLDAGLDREDVRILAGHESLATLRAYTEEGDMERALAAHRRLSPADVLLRRRR